LLFADADGATDINDLSQMLESIQKADKKDLACAIGSRNQAKA